MKQVRYIFLLLLLSCSSSKVITDYDSNTDFSQFKTYGFFEDVGAGFNEFDIKRLLNSIDVHMKKLGFRKTETPDFYINFIAIIGQSTHTNTIGIGIGSGGVNGGFGISGGIPIGNKKLNEEITLEFVASKTDELFWKGILNSSIKENRKPEEREFYFNEVIHKILQSYPLKNR